MKPYFQSLTYYITGIHKTRILRSKTPKELNVIDPQWSLRNWGEMDTTRKQPGTG